MANFSVSQVNQLYVAKAYSDTIDDSLSAGTIGAFKTADGKMFFSYMGADTVLRSDMIDLKNVEVRAIKASDMATKLKQVEVTVDDDLVAGEDYVLRINFYQFFSPGDDSQYLKDAVVRVTSSMTKSDFYLALLDSLNYNFSRESEATSTTNPYLTFEVDDTTTATKLIITEKEQPWTLGIKKQRRVLFDVYSTQITNEDGDEVTWATVTDTTASAALTVGNGKNIADLEWFCMGERGDQYRGMGWPNYIPTTYLVDSSENYSIIAIHHAFVDSGVSSYRTEKDLTIVVPDGETGSVYTVINTIIEAMNTAADTTLVSTLSE